MIYTENKGSMREKQVWAMFTETAKVYTSTIHVLGPDMLKWQEGLAMLDSWILNKSSWRVRLTLTFFSV